ncbi:hypothetical protein KEJ23_01355 [Candidatus Bathyarchaeota archaeon]|nr:hypothetical protein [Candidatus Bathyarchaeota archaeon]
MRPKSLGNYLGTDGVKLGDFAEAEISDSGLEFAKMPTMLIVRRGLSKVKNQYFTFVPEQGITYVKEYLEERVKLGEKLSRDSPL